MARIDLNNANGWIPEEYDSNVIKAVQQTSAVAQVARKVTMGTDTKHVPTATGADPRIVAEGGTIPEASMTLGEKILVARKYAEIFHISEEDVNDALVSTLDVYKGEWARKWAVKFDNACLGVTAAEGTTEGTIADRPYTSVYKAASDASRVQATAGALTLDKLSDSLGLYEVSEYFDPSSGVIIAHPSLKAQLRTLKDSAGNLVMERGDALGAGRERLFDYEVVWSLGAKTSAAQSSAPAGNSLIVIGDRNLLIEGVRSGPESQVSRDAKFDTDGVLLKVRARRGFVVGDAKGFSVVEITAGP